MKRAPSTCGRPGKMGKAEGSIVCVSETLLCSGFHGMPFWALTKRWRAVGFRCGSPGAGPQPAAACQQPRGKCSNTAKRAIRFANGTSLEVFYTEREETSNVQTSALSRRHARPPSSPRTSRTTWKARRVSQRRKHAVPYPLQNPSAECPVRSMKKVQFSADGDQS